MRLMLARECVKLALFAILIVPGRVVRAMAWALGACIGLLVLMTLAETLVAIFFPCAIILSFAVLLTAAWGRPPTTRAVRPRRGPDLGGFEEVCETIGGWLVDFVHSAVDLFNYNIVIERRV